MHDALPSGYNCETPQANEGPLTFPWDALPHTPTDADQQTAHEAAAVMATVVWTTATLVPNGSLLAISSPFNSLFKVLFIFPSQSLFAIGLLPIFILSWNLPPTLS